MRDRSRGNTAPDVGVVLVAAGSSSRMGGQNKMFCELEGVAVVVKAALALAECPSVCQIVMVCRQEDIPRLWELQREFDIPKIAAIVAGGKTRQQSVFTGIRALGEECGLFAIHDGARPFVSSAVVGRCIALCRQTGAVCAGVPVKDTIKEVDESGNILSTPDRARLYLAQTPQVFERQLYLRAMARAEETGGDFTDDCQLVEQLGYRVMLARGDYLNFKITTPEDLVLARAISAGEITWD